MPTRVKVCLGCQRQHADPVTHLDPAGLGQRGVDRDLVVGARAAPLAQFDPAGLTGPVHAEARRTDRGHHLAVGADEPGPVGDRDAVGGGDPGHVADAVDLGGRHGGGDAFGVLVHAAGAEVGHRPDLDVGVGVDAVEELVEGATEGVGEHECAGDERRAQHDGQPGQDQPDLAGEQALEGRADHCPSPAIASSRFIVSSTDSGVGPVSSATTRPSARKTTRSA